jgi:hypothetical protein
MPHGNINNPKSIVTPKGVRGPQPVVPGAPTAGREPGRRG